MAKFSLIPFEKNEVEFNLSSEITHQNNRLYLSYMIEGDLSTLDLDQYTPNKKRQLRLWEKTCFEFFLCDQNGEYLEFNFSPNFSWNLFHFKTLRGPIHELEINQNPEIDILNSNTKFLLIANFNLSTFPENFKDIKKLKFGITSVLKLINHETEYWALKHCDSKPNFHHYSSFIGKF